MFSPSPVERENCDSEVLKLREALKMLYDLLEAYGPFWYTREHHDKAQEALRYSNNDIHES